MGREADTLVQESRVSVSPEESLRGKHALFTGARDPVLSSLWGKARAVSAPLGELANVNFGKQLRDRKRHVRDVIRVTPAKRVPPGYRPCYTGRDVARYHVAWSRLACLDDDIARRGGCWDARMQNAKGKLLTRQVGRYPEFALDDRGYQCLNTIFMVNLKRSQLDPRYVLGILNSRLTAALWIGRFYDQQQTFPKIKGTYLKELPIRQIDFARETDQRRHERMVALVKQMLDLYKQLKEAKTPHERKAGQRQIEATDRQIDHLVYELYGLTEQEIRIVEEAGQ